MSIIINQFNRLENNILVRNDYVANYDYLQFPTDLKTYYSNGAIWQENWYPGVWLLDGIQISNQKYDIEMSRLRPSKMDEKWFAIILMHLTNWDTKYNPLEEFPTVLHSYTKIKLSSVLDFIKNQNWSIDEINNLYIESVDSNWINIKESLILDFFNEIKSQKMFLINYAIKKFNNDNNNSNEYIYIENEITKNILNSLNDIIEINNDYLIYLDSKDNIFEFESKEYIRNLVTYHNEKRYFYVGEKLLLDIERFIDINNSTHDLKKVDFNELLESNPILIELKKQSKIIKKENNTSLNKTQNLLLSEWFGVKNFKELKFFILNEVIKKLKINNFFYSLNEYSNLFKLGKNYLGLNVYISEADQLKHIASDDNEFSKEFRKNFVVKNYSEYSEFYETYDKTKEYIFFEINNLNNLSEDEKQKLEIILAQGRSHRNFIWFNLPNESIKRLKKMPLGWNIMSLYLDKEEIPLDFKKEIHPQLYKIVKKVFLSQNQNEFFI